MRLDKYLKLSRVIKRRTVANEVCDAGRVSANGRPVRASYQVKEGDEIEVVIGERAVRFRVLSTDERKGREAARDMYELLSE